MTINEHNCVKDKMALLAGMPLQSITRAADMLCLHLGNLVETESFYRDENGDLARRADGGLATRKTMVGEYALHVQCHFRMRCGCDIMFAKCDLYQPTEATASRQDDDDFDVQDLGNNRLDEIIAEQFASPAGFVVKRATVNRIGDITIEFTNDFVFETQIDVSGSQECWRFFKYADDEHLVIGAAGIIDQEE